MRSYECMYILDSELPEDVLKATIQKNTDFITKSATIDKVDEWGKKRLAYKINHKLDGYYVLMHFKAEPEFPKVLERQLSITDGVLKYLVLNKDA